MALEQDPCIRVGADYQAQIPTMIDDYKRSELFRYGLPIPVMWINPNNPKTSITEAMDCVEEMNQERKDNDLLPFPSSFGERRSMIQRDSFVLALYLFSKNFRLMNKFLGDKGIGSIQSYYYGEFYNSGDHLKWSKWHKERLKSPRNIFTYWSLHELLSRLSCNMIDEDINNLKKMGRQYMEGRLSIEAFVFTLLNNVGMNRLVEAMAIGKEDHDLMIFKMSNNSSHDHSHVIEDLSIQNVCFCTKQEDIIQILKGDIKISKTQSDELFWGAIWPRLSARGWHSEPHNSKNLVFLVPGVVKFSRKRLKKGIHYFNSSTDLLKKVVSEPDLLQFESDEVESMNTPDVHEDDDQDLDMFLIMDTSLGYGGNGFLKLIEFTTFTADQEGVFKNSRCVFDSPGDVGVQVASPLENSEFEGIVEELNSDQGEILVTQRRQSMRNRMLTTKALEAFAYGYLSPKKKRKNAEGDAYRLQVSGGGGGGGGEGDEEQTADGATDMDCDSPE